MRPLRKVLLALFLALAVGRSALGQSTASSDSLTGGAIPPAAPRDSVTVIPGPEYHASGLVRLLVGNGYRDLWSEPIRVPVLDLDHFAGGLTPLKVGATGGETWSLHMQGADGEEYVLRSVDKHVKLGPEVSSGVPAWLLRQQISAGLATGSLVVAPLLQAAGVPHENPILRVVPDNPRLGEYRTQFAGLLVWVEHRPRTDDTSKISKVDKMLQAISTNPDEHLDSRGYLTARLMDIYIGDWDRSSLQWWWDRTGQKHNHVWRAIPHDRDWAFANNEGILYWNLRQTSPWFVEYRPKYPNLIGLEAVAWGQDRRLLQDLEYPVWDSTAKWLKSVLTDSVIDYAVSRLPPPERARYGPQLTTALRARRDKLPWMATSFYHTVAAEPDVHTVAVPSIIDIKRWRDTVEIRARTRDADSTIYYDRRFAVHDTKEIRLYVDGGPDSIAVSGGGDHILVRLIAGADGDVLVEHATAGAGATKVYDAHHHVRIITGDVSVDHAPYIQPTLLAGTPEASRSPVSFLVRDAGSWCQPATIFTGSSVSGLLVETGTQCDRFGFRRSPWAVQNTITAGYAFGPGGVSGTYSGAIRAVGGSPVYSLNISGTSSQYIWFYGISNESGHPLPDNDYRAREAQFNAAPMISFHLAPRIAVSVSPEVRYSDVEQTVPQYFNLTRPYGSGPFGVVDGMVSATYDTRGARYADSSGLHLQISGRGVPAVWSATSAYGTAHAEADGFVFFSNAPLKPLADLRVGGDKVWGVAPFQDLATVGGATTVRGYYPGRFSGDAALYAQAQLFLTLARWSLAAPGTFGVLALNDVGRVFVSGEQSGGWHDGFGGGLWWSFLNRHYLISMSLVHSPEHNVFYVGLGLGW